MPFYCPNCGEKEEFYGTRQYTEWGRETVYLDNEGNVEDYGDREASDSESEGVEDESCCSCDTGASWFETEEEVEEAERERLKKEKVTNWKEVILNEN
jgi:hypothetical protein